MVSFVLFISVDQSYAHFPPKEVALRRAREWEVLKSAKEAFEEEEEARAALLRRRGGERAVRGEVSEEEWKEFVKVGF